MEKTLLCDVEGILIVVGGPTAVGKTAVSIELAEWLGTEIISADSRQCYREMTIGTAKPTAEELDRVKHHFIDSHSISETFSAGDFSREAGQRLAELDKKYPVVITTGGSGLYLDAFINGISEIPEVDPALRESLNKKAASEGIGKLAEELEKFDPVYVRNADMKNPQRVIRALEVCLQTGKPFSEYRNRPKKGGLNRKVVALGLDADRSWLYDRINRRVEHMVRKGLFDEARGLYAYRDHYALKTVGYQEIFEYMDGNYSQQEAIEQIQQNSRRYAKRQLTWFRKFKGMEWFHPGNLEGIRNYVTQVTGLS
ncbi:MAG: tRNA (adenosine(37)-N6)-dimethylallyltransferase MiaA [Cyclobacteriaceae bacterium]